MVEHRSSRPTTTPEDGSSQQPVLAAGGRYSRAITTAVVQQAVVLSFTSLLLDGGRVCRFCVVAALASWVGTLVIMLRRPKQPTNPDLAFVKFGFWFAIAVVIAIGFVVDLGR